ncbi:MAG: SDR family oxidoreductase [Acidobacteria bacterium]|nr:MAG: SDR family oxidoreductase [Acidobacteriota bacterium]
MKTLKQLWDLSGRGAVVVGGAGHIGRAAAEGLIELGASVVIADLDAAKCASTAAELTATGPGRAHGIGCDLSDEASTREMVRATVKSLGRLDIVVHTAAFVGTTPIPGWAVPFDQQTVAAWDAALRVNLTSPFVIAQEARQALESSGHGSIILVGSTYGLVGPDMRLYDGTKMGNPAGYGASKGGVLQLGRYLATVFAPKIRVNAVTPGGVWRNQPEAFHERYVFRTPLGRMASEEDMKGAVAYLASDLSAYVTGHNLVVDGGWTAW